MTYEIKFTRYHLNLQAIDDENTPLGYLSLLFEGGGDDAKLMGLIRHPDYKGLGICRDLTQTALNICDALHIQNVYCGILKKRTGYMKLLKSMRFKEIECKSDKHRRFRREFMEKT